MWRGICWLEPKHCQCWELYLMACLNTRYVPCMTYANSGSSRVALLEYFSQSIRVCRFCASNNLAPLLAAFTRIRKCGPGWKAEVVVIMLCKYGL